jgi:zinc/manganese transport system permease protein
LLAAVPADSSVRLTLNVVDDLRQVLAYHFMFNALRAGTIVAVVAGLVGWFMVLRRQAFAGHALAVIGFPGGAGATWLGINVAYGFFGFCVGGALVIALASGGRQATAGGYSDESAVVGTVQAFALGCGFLFVSLYKGLLDGVNSLLFGTISGVSDAQVRVLAIAGVLCLVSLVALGRPLLFASLDPAVARARGVPVRLVSVAFLVLLGVAAAGTSQVTGSLLVFALLVAPAAAAQQLTARPGLGLGLSVVLAVLVTWVGEVVAFFSVYPIGFWVPTLAFGAYLAARSTRIVREHRDPAGRHSGGAAETG